VKVEKVKYNTMCDLECKGNGPQREELDIVLNGKHVKIAAITESKRKLEGTMETINYIVIYIYIYIIYAVFCLTTGPKPLPKRFPHTVRLPFQMRGSSPVLKVIQ
jgi:hypothetical protein